MKRRAAIDIGTNTALLLVADVTDRAEIDPVYQEERIVRLGEGVDESRNLSQAAIIRVGVAVTDYIRRAAELGAQSVVISGTSAVRDAGNRERLLTEIKDRVGLVMRVLTGQEEAALTYFGALSNKPNLQGKILLADIGGGSTEFLFGSRDRIERSVSLDIGSVRLTERHIRNDPATSDELDEITGRIRAQFAEQLASWRTRIDHFVGVAGTVTTVAAIDLGMEVYDADKVDNYVLTQETLDEILQQLRQKNLHQRKAIAGLRPERADVIIAGVAILAEIFSFFELKEMVVSDRGLRFGLLLEAEDSGWRD